MRTERSGCAFRRGPGSSCSTCCQVNPTPREPRSWTSQWASQTVREGPFPDRTPRPRRSFWSRASRCAATYSTRTGSPCPRTSSSSGRAGSPPCETGPSTSATSLRRLPGHAVQRRRQACRPPADPRRPRAQHLTAAAARQHPFLHPRHRPRRARQPRPGLGSVCVDAHR